MARLVAPLTDQEIPALIARDQEVADLLAAKADSAALTAHVADVANPHAVTKTQVGLASVDNVQQQPLDADLTAIAALDSAQSGVVSSDGAGWIRKTFTQVKTALGLTKADVGLANVDNTSDVNKPVSTAQAAADALKVNKAGDTLTGNLVVPAPTLDTHATTRGAATARELARLENLILNGYGGLGDNSNFSGFAFDASRATSGRGSFRYTTFHNTIQSDEMIPIDIDSMYLFEAWAIADPYVGARHYIGLAPYDIDGNSVQTQGFNIAAGTQTTLAAPLAPGDATVTLTSATNWTNGGAGPHVVIWPWTSVSGLPYPNPPDPKAYSRRYHAFSAPLTGNVVTLASPWPNDIIRRNPNDAGGVWPIGTIVAMTNSTSTYIYTLAVNVVVPGVWTKYQKHVGRPSTGGAPTSMFYPGTAQVKLVFLLNRDTPGGAINIGAIRFGLHPRALQSPDGTWREIKVDNAGVLTAPALSTT